LGEYGDSSRVDVSTGAASSTDASADLNDWVTSLRDLELTWNGAIQSAQEDTGRAHAEWLQPLSDEPQTRGETAAGGRTATADLPESGAWWQMLPDEDPAFDIDRAHALPPEDGDDWIDEISGDWEPLDDLSAKPFTAPPGADAPAPKRSRRRVAAVAAAAVLLAGGVVAFLALAARNGENKRNPTAVTTIGRGNSTTITSAARPTITSAPPATATSSSVLPPGARPFTVQSTCGARQCALGVRDGPAKTAREVNSLRTGQVVQIDCATHGEQVRDTDTGRQSDVWYRYLGTNNYSSGLYLQGPPVPSC
jgi:hypothetical protein